MTFRLGTSLGIFGFGPGQRLELRTMCFARLMSLSINFGAARIFHGAHPPHFLFSARDFLIRDPAMTLLLGVFASFRFDSQLLLLSAPPRGFFFGFAPAFLLDQESVLGRCSLSLNFGPAGIFFGAQTQQFCFQLTYFFGSGGWCFCFARMNRCRRWRAGFLYAC